jgi:hypothetical protein
MPHALAFDSPHTISMHSESAYKLEGLLVRHYLLPALIEQLGTPYNTYLPGL